MDSFEFEQLAVEEDSVGNSTRRQSLWSRFKHIIIPIIVSLGLVLAVISVMVLRLPFWRSEEAPTVEFTTNNPLVNTTIDMTMGSGEIYDEGYVPDPIDILDDGTTNKTGFKDFEIYNVTQSGIIANNQTVSLAPELGAAISLPAEIIKSPESEYFKKIMSSILNVTEFVDKTITFKNDEELRSFFKSIATEFNGVIVKSYYFKDYVGGRDELMMNVLIDGVKCSLRRISGISGAKVYPLNYESSPHLFLNTYSVFTRKTAIAGHDINTTWYVVESDYKTIDPIRHKYSVSEVKTVVVDMMKIFDILSNQKYMINKPHWMNLVGMRDPVSKKIIRVKLADIGNIAASEPSTEPETLEVHAFDFIKSFLKLAIMRIKEDGKNKKIQGYFTPNNIENISTAARLRLVDFYYVISGYCDHPPANLEHVLHHPFISGGEFHPGTDEYGRRYYSLMRTTVK